MPLVSLDHVNVRTGNLPGMIDWYTRVLGMRQGNRPDFSFDGAWMYVGDNPVVHLVAVNDEAGAGSETTLKLEHFALSATDWNSFERVLKAENVRYATNVLTGFNILQCNLSDPDGNHLHVDFPADENPQAN